MRITTSTAAAAGALFAGIAALLAIVQGSYIIAPVAALATIGCAATLLPRRDRNTTDPQLVQRAMTQAESGRKLAIYERDTGFFSYWYLELRCAEECYRAQRYGHPLALIVVEPSQGNDEWTVQGEIAGWLRRNAREADLIAYTGNGRFVSIMPETDRKGAKQLVSRLKKALSKADAAISLFPEDGETLADLLTTAVQGLDTPQPAPDERAQRVA